MKRFWNRIKRRILILWNSDIEYYLSAVFLSFSFFLCFRRYYDSVLRFFSSIKDLALSLAHYFVFVFKRLFERILGHAPTVNVTVNDIPSIELQKFIPFSIEELQRKLSYFGEAIFDINLFLDYNEFLLVNLRKYALLGSLLVPCFGIIFYLFRDSLLKTNDKPAGSYSRACEVYFYAYSKFSYAVRKCVNYVRFVYERKKLRYAFLIIWFINLNMFTIFISAIAYYFYFVSSFNILSFFKQIVKFFIDVVIMLSGAPIIFWIFVAFAIFVYLSLKKGYEKLEHMEAKNCGFLKTIDYLFLIIGPPGAGKTSLLVDIGLSFVNIFKQTALDIMFAMEMLFPAFPFSAFRKEIEERIKTREIDRLPRGDLFVDHIEDVYNRTPSDVVLYGYKSDLFAYDKDTGTDLIDIFSAMRIYARAFFIYNNNNNIISAIPIRNDGKFDDSKHLKKWNGDFFKRSMKKSLEDSVYSHVFDEDIFRAGHKMDESNPLCGTLGYGIWLKPELGKSHGNQNETEDVRKDDDECNEKNDLYHWSLKMPRHAVSVVYNNVFFRYGSDEQRAEDVPAKIRMLMSVIKIADKSEVKLALPCAAALNKFYEGTYKKFINFYEDYLNKRSDMVLSVLLYKFAVSGLYNAYWWLFNTFGYVELTLELEKGSTYGEADSEKKTHIYYFMFKKAYGKKYSTDSHSPYYAKEQLAASLGMIDTPTFSSLQMTDEEIDQLHDFFFEKLKHSNGVAKEQEERDVEYKKKGYTYGDPFKKSGKTKVKEEMKGKRF